uniref:Uncharacterized protein n=1 Tax=Triticum urartu TaxID=4572 RepID=A0A8R7TLM8_TRIUA
MLGDLARKKQLHLSTQPSERARNHQAHPRQHRALKDHRSNVHREPLRGTSLRKKIPVLGFSAACGHPYALDPRIFTSPLFSRCFLL